MKSLRNPNRRPTHPGAVLREDVLPALEMPQGRLAELLGVSRLTVSQLLHEQTAPPGRRQSGVRRCINTGGPWPQRATP